MSKVVVRYWAAARAATGVDEDRFDASTAGDAIAASVEAHPALEEVLKVATLLVDGRRADSGAELADGSIVEVLPPFAGG